MFMSRREEHNTAESLVSVGDDVSVRTSQSRVSLAALLTAYYYLTDTGAVPTESNITSGGTELVKIVCISIILMYSFEIGLFFSL